MADCNAMLGLLAFVVMMNGTVESDTGEHGNGAGGMESDTGEHGNTDCGIKSED